MDSLYQENPSVQQLMYGIINNEYNEYSQAEIAAYWNITFNSQQYNQEIYAENRGGGTFENTASNHVDGAHNQSIFNSQQYNQEIYAENRGGGTVENAASNHVDSAHNLNIFNSQQYNQEIYAENRGGGTFENTASNHVNGAHNHNIFNSQQYNQEIYVENRGSGTVENTASNHVNGAHNRNIFNSQQYNQEIYAENRGGGTVKYTASNHVNGAHNRNIFNALPIASEISVWQPIAVDLQSTNLFCPQAIRDYCALSDSERKKPQNSIRAKNHLLSIGWKIEHNNYHGNGRFRYISPDGVLHRSLYQVCLQLMEQERKDPSSRASRDRVVHQQVHLNGVVEENQAAESKCGDLDCRGDVAVQKECRSQLVIGSGGLGLRKRKLECNNFDVDAGSCQRNKLQVFRSRPATSAQFNGNSSGLSVIASPLKKARQGRPADCLVNSSELKRGKGWNGRTTSTSLSYLVDSGVVSLGQKACYLNRKDNHVMAEGQITREGIICVCCRNVYGLSKFEVHAGSSNRRAAANIFLEDGRSLAQCQMQMKHVNELKGFEHDPHMQIYSNPPHPDIQQVEGDEMVEGSTGYLQELIERNLPRFEIQQMENGDEVKGNEQDQQKQMDSDPPQPDIRQMEGDEKVEGSTRYLHEPIESNLPHFEIQQMENGNEVKGYEQDPQKQMDSDLPHPDIRKMEGDEKVEDSTGYFHEQIKSNSPHPEIQQMENGNDVKGGYLHKQIESNQPQLKIQQMEGDYKVNGFTGHLHEETKSNARCSVSNGLCNICRHYGNELVVCGGGCLSIFHLSCICLKDFPDSVWFCPSCRCGLCGEGEFNDGEQFVEKTILYCDQCERGFHVGCLRERGDRGLESCPEGNWFCGEKCSKIFFHLQNLLGKLNPTGVDGLSWTILRANEKDGHEMTKRKLMPARSVLRECFKQIIQPITKADLVTDVVFSKESTLPHQNFRGFYTMILYKGKKPITVATFRIHGAKVAELPLVGTRIVFRRRGNCRLLMNNLQKLLYDIGVEKLLLPAAPKLLQTWISSFGFVVMTTSDRFELLAYPFLEFTDTIMCQKLLMTSTAKALESRDSKEGVKNRFCKRNVKMDRHRYSNSSKVIQRVGPINTLPSKSIWLEDFGSEASNGKETSAHYSLRSNCSGSLALIQGPIRQTSAMKQMVTT